MLTSQRDKFDLPKEVSYFNCASLSPLMKSLADVGRHTLDRRTRPYEVTIKDWFEPVAKLKNSYAQLINCNEPDRIALIPSVSYGMATVAQNVQLDSNDEILILDQQFPSNYYSWQKLADLTGASLTKIGVDIGVPNRGALWNESIIDAISERTKIVALANIHWTDGTLFQLEKISQKAKENNALLIIDGSQSIGALPFDVEKIKPDAVFCVGYKWLLGTYGLGFAYFGERFDNGTPIEENWINRKDSQDFRHLVDYTDQYRPKAGRYSVGEHSSFQLVAILNGAIEQLLDWGVHNIQHYCKTITKEAVDELRLIGCQIEDDAYRAHHLFGIRFKKKMDMESLQQSLKERNVYLSVRGTSLRIAVNVYNEAKDLEKLVNAIKENI